MTGIAANNSRNHRSSGLVYDTFVARHSHSARSVGEPFPVGRCHRRGGVLSEPGSPRSDRDLIERVDVFDEYTGASISEGVDACHVGEGAGAKGLVVDKSGR